MISQKFSRNVREILICLFMMAVMVTANSRTGYAQIDPLNPDAFIGAEVVAINGDIIECKNGLSADISTAKNQRKIEIGDKLNAFGKLMPDASHPTLIKAVTTTVHKNRDVEFGGTISNVDVQGFTIFNQRVSIDRETEIFDNIKLQSGQGAYVYTESTGSGFRAVSVSVTASPKDVDTSLISSIVSIEGHKVSLAGGYYANVTQENLDFFQHNNIGVNSPVFVNLRQEPKSKKLKTPFIGLFSVGKGLSGMLQDVDQVNRTITVLNQKVTLDKFVSISDDKGQLLNLSDLNPTTVEKVVVFIDTSANREVAFHVIAFLKK